MAIHHLTEYSLNGGEWLQAYADEEAGPGKTLTIPDLAAGTYDVRLRITPLTGGGPAVVSESVELVIEGGASVSQSQLKQVQDIQAALSFIASGAQVAAVQVSSALGSMLFSGSVSQSQTLQSELVSGGGIILGSLVQAQPAQSNSVASVLEYLGSVASGQSVQSEAASGDYIVPIAGDVNVSQSVQAEASSAALVFYGTVSDSQAVQSRTANGLLSFVGNSAVNQVKQSEAISSALAFSGSVAESQIKQSEAVSATTGAAIPATPATFTVSNSPAQITAVFDDEVAGATSYKLYYSTDSGMASPTVISGITASPYNIPSGLTPATTYYFQISAVNAAGESDLFPSAEPFRSATTEAAAAPTTYNFTSDAEGWNHTAANEGDANWSATGGDSTSGCLTGYDIGYEGESGQVNFNYTFANTIALVNDDTLTFRLKTVGDFYSMTFSVSDGTRLRTVANGGLSTSYTQTGSYVSVTVTVIGDGVASGTKNVQIAVMSTPVEGSTVNAWLDNVIIPAGWS